MADWIPKEYYTILLDGIPVSEIGKYLYETLGLSEKTVVQSHFYTAQDGDFVYADSLNLNAYFAGKGSASVHLKTVRFDRVYHDGTCLICSDGARAALECDIEAKDFDMQRLPELQAWLTAQVRAGIAEFASISYTLDTEPLFEIGKGVTK